jgi:hypothetical protein
MTRNQVSKLKIGDTIEVKTVHYRIGWRTATRKIVAKDDYLGIGIRMFGWNPFWLKHKEILRKL